MGLLPLKDALDGKVITRFPPEASGFLHLGHIKALLLNYCYAKQYNGKLILRFDDTNPDKENVVYEQAIMDDIQTLGLSYDIQTYASDYFDRIIELAIELIKKGLAYVDFSTQETIEQNRIQFIPSQYRDTNIDTNRKLFQQMLIGDNKNGCLRAKIDYTSKNGCMRDPVIMRPKNRSHPRQGTKYCIYPTYDFACPILDALEGVTHAMRSVEYKDRDAQYEWFLDRLGLKNGLYPIILNYGKLSFTHTVLSKRKLAKLIDTNFVDGWSDPRLPTIRGILRNGMQVKPLLDYIQTQILSKNIVLLNWDKLWHTNAVYLDKSSLRLFGLGPNMRKVILTGDFPTFVNLPDHPKDISTGTREIKLTSQLIVNSDDFSNVAIGTRYTLIGLGNTTVTDINPLTLQYNRDDNDYKSTMKITWLPDDNRNILATVKTYSLLLNKPKPEKNDDIVEIFNSNSLSEHLLLVENSIKNIPVRTTIQIMRLGYCYLERNDDEVILHKIPSK